MKNCLIVFSKNRPLQLDLCLTSINENVFKDDNATKNKTEIYVLYKCDDKYVASYETLKSEHPSVHFWVQSSSLFKDIETILHLAKSEDTGFAGFLTDDCIFYKKTDIFKETTLSHIFDGIMDYRNRGSLVCSLSLRLGLNVDRRQIRNHKNELEWINDPLEYTSNQRIHKTPYGLVFYDRTVHFHGGYWNYPMSVDGHIYQIDEIFEYVEELAYLDNIKDWDQTPNSFEQALQRYIGIAKPFQAMPDYSCIVNSPNNRVQDTIKNDQGDYFDISADHFLDLYEKGKRVDINKLTFDVRCPHTEINLLEGIEQ